MSIHLACIYCDRPTIETIALPPGWKPDHLSLLTAADITGIQRHFNELHAKGEPKIVVDWDAHGVCPECWKKHQEQSMLLPKAKK